MTEQEQTEPHLDDETLKGLENLCLEEGTRQDNAVFITRIPTMRAVISATCHYYGIDPATINIRQKGDKRHFRARQIAISLSKKMCRKSCRAIGTKFHRKHSAIVYTIRRMKELREMDEIISMEIADIEDVMKRNEN